MDFQNFDGVPTLIFDQLSIHFLFSLFHHLTGGRCTGVSTQVHSFLLLFFFLSSLSLSSFVSRLGGGRCSDIDRACEVRHLRVPTYV